MDLSMDQLSAFLQDKWYVAVIAIIVLLMIIKMVKTMVKWVLVLAIVAVVLVYGSSYKDKLGTIQETIAQTAGSAIAKEVQTQAAKALQGEAKEATFTKNSDGSYTVKSKTIRLDGKPGDAEVKVTVAGQSFSMKADSVVQAFIDQAQKNK